MKGIIKAVQNEPKRVRKKPNNIDEAIKFIDRFYKDKEPFAVMSDKARYKFSRDYMKSYLDEYISKEKGTFISVGSIKDLSKRAVSSNVKSLKMIVIDLDAHNGSSPEAIKNTYNALETMGLYDYIPMPQFVTLTGRGVQLAYAIDNITLSKKKDDYIALYKDTIRTLQAAANKGVEELSEFNLSNLEVDNKVSAISQLIRLPGTYNPKSKTITQIIRDNSNIENYRIGDLISEYKEQVEFSTQTKLTVRFDESHQHLLEVRVKDMFRLQEIRNGNKTIIGHRQSMLSNYLYCLLSLNPGMNESELMDKARIYNQGFYYPLKNSEVVSTVKGAFPYKKENPRISNESMSKFLSISKEEAQYMNTIGLTTKEQISLKNERNMDAIMERQEQNRANKKIENYNQKMLLIEGIRELIKTMSKEELIKKYKISERTLKNYLSDEYVESIKKPTEKDYELQSKYLLNLAIRNQTKKANARKKKKKTSVKK